MDAVVDFGEFAFGRPSELRLLLFFEVLEFFYQIDLSIHLETLITKLGNPAWDLKWSNSTTLKQGL